MQNDGLYYQVCIWGQIQPVATHTDTNTFSNIGAVYVHPRQSEAHTTAEVITARCHGNNAHTLRPLPWILTGVTHEERWALRLNPGPASHRRTATGPLQPPRPCLWSPGCLDRWGAHLRRPKPCWHGRCHQAASGAAWREEVFLTYGLYYPPFLFTAALLRAPAADGLMRMRTSRELLGDNARQSLPTSCSPLAYFIDALSV